MLNNYQIKNESCPTDNNYTYTINTKSHNNPKSRLFFYYKEKLHHEEDETTEYKNYKLPFNTFNNTSNKQKNSNNIIDTSFIIKKLYCSFLNHKGGRLYIGINDDLIVEGNFINLKERDNIKRHLLNLSDGFYPNCRSEKIKVHFIPIKSRINERYLIDYFVVKVVIKPGDKDKLYSINRRGFKSYLRNQNQCVELEAMEIEEMIMKKKMININDKNLMHDLKQDNYDDMEVDEVIVDSNLIIANNELMLTSLPVRSKSVDVVNDGNRSNLSKNNLKKIEDTTTRVNKFKRLDKNEYENENDNDIKNKSCFNNNVKWQSSKKSNECSSSNSKDREIDDRNKKEKLSLRESYFSSTDNISSNNNIYPLSNNLLSNEKCKLTITNLPNDRLEIFKILSQFQILYPLGNKINFTNSGKVTVNSIDINSALEIKNSFDNKIYKDKVIKVIIH